ncbi:hypothetical protein F4780DRAFT_775351 [Xylariomycetidae sp. FL0641]|nr:hypothetical protein F4780DRAFT_775351 [Xylariomycetidae sp. FL0641]
MTPSGSLYNRRPLRKRPRSRQKNSVDALPSFSPCLAFMLPVLVLLLPGASEAQRDPVTDFCRRFGHQTALIDRNIYIDGGLINWNPLSSDPANHTNTWLSYQSLDHEGLAGMPQLYANLSKNASIPTVSGGALWGDDVNKKFYLFGGEYSEELPPEKLAIYVYDVLENNWQVIGEPPETIQSVSYGASVSISETGQAFYYGGWASNKTSQGWTGPRKATKGLVQYVIDADDWSNDTTGPDSLGRAEGAMVYLPISDGGMLVYFGGLQEMENGTIVGQPMEQILVYDIASSRWYQQKADGEVPEMRRMPPSTAGFDDVYVLSLPSFTWIKFYPDDNTTDQYPHNTLTCNVIDGAQMIIIGGTFPLDDSCDVPDQWGSHSLDLGKQNPDNAVWYLYRSNLAGYLVPDEITDVIGGGLHGGATRHAPKAGFDEHDLSVLMARTYTAAPRAPTRDVADPHGDGDGDGDGADDNADLSRGAVAGIAVGAAAAALLAALAGFCWCARRRRRRRGHRDASGGGGKPPDATAAAGLIGPYTTSTTVAGTDAAAWSPYTTSVSPSVAPPPPPPPPPPHPHYHHHVPGPVELDGGVGVGVGVVATPRSPSAYSHHQHHHHQQHSPVVVAAAAATSSSTGTTRRTSLGGHDDNAAAAGSWNPSPVMAREPAFADRTEESHGGSSGSNNNNDNRYATAGFGPSELSSEGVEEEEQEGQGPAGLLQPGRVRHQTYYHP